MAKVRIKRKTNPGDQMDYSLVTGNTYGYQDGGTMNNVNNTLKTVPKEEANVEAERGETVVGDFNQDGMLEHSKISGKRHYEGGTNVTVPDGSFFFSDTRKLKIKDKDTLKFFNKGKKALTPAKIAKQYDLNEYNNILKDPLSTRIEKDTAMKMLSDNTQKLAQLAMVQESMKGFPDGIPSFVESVMAPQGEQQPQSFKYGGVKKMQDAGEKYRDPIYSNIPIRYINDPRLRNQPGLVEAIKSIPNNTVPDPLYSSIPRRNITVTNKGIIYPNVSENIERIAENIPNVPTVEDIMSLKGTPSPSIPGRSLISANPADIRNYGKVGRALGYVAGAAADALIHDLALINQGSIDTGITIENFLYDMFASPPDQPYSITPKVTPVNTNTVDPLVIIPNTYLPSSTPPAGVKVDAPVKKDSIPPSSLRKVRFEYGGTKKMQDGGWEDETVENENDGKIYVLRKYKNGNVDILDRSGNFIKRLTPEQSKSVSTPVDNKPNANKPGSGKPASTGKHTDHTVLTPPPYTQIPDRINKLIESRPELKGNVLYSTQDFGTFGMQRTRPDGTFSSDHSVNFDIADLKARHGDWIEETYTSDGGKGFDQFVKDVMTRSKTAEATGWFQDQVNKYVTEEFGPDAKYFAPDADSPYGRDAHYGQVTFSVPRYFKLKKPAAPDTPVPVAPTQSPNLTIEKPAVRERVLPKVQTYAPQGKDRRRGWWLQDIANFAQAATDKIKEFPPVRQQVRLNRATPTYLDPSRQIASSQEQMSRFQDLAQNTSEGAVARANVLGSSGEGARQIADIISNYDNQNTQIANQTDQFNTQIGNQEIMTNTELDDQYMQRLATLKQQTANARRELWDRRLKAFNQGHTNMVRRNMMEEVLYPQYTIDPISGEISFTKGKDPRAIDITSGASSIDSLQVQLKQAAQVLKLKDDLIASGVPEEDAKYAIANIAKNSRANSVTADELFRQQYMQSMLGGYNL